MENINLRTKPGTIDKEQDCRNAGFPWGDHMHNNDKVLVYSGELGRIADALISSGYTSLDDQAKALGLGRSTAWTIAKNKHKLGRLSAKTINRILANPQTPPAVRAVLDQYVAQRYAVVRGKRKRTLPASLDMPRTKGRLV